MVQRVHGNVLEVLAAWDRKDLVLRGPDPGVEAAIENLRTLMGADRPVLRVRVGALVGAVLIGMLLIGTPAAARMHVDRAGSGQYVRSHAAFHRIAL